MRSVALFFASKQNVSIYTTFRSPRLAEEALNITVIHFNGARKNIHLHMLNSCSTGKLYTINKMKELVEATSHCG